MAKRNSTTPKAATAVATAAPSSTPTESAIAVSPATPTAAEVRHLVTAQVSLPGMGIALPIGVGFHQYIRFEVVGELKRETAEETAAALADEQFPGHKGVTIHAVSELPETW